MPITGAMTDERGGGAQLSALSGRSVKLRRMAGSNTYSLGLDTAGSIATGWIPIVRNILSERQLRTPSARSV